jgi:HD superfamily phosphohydrolase
LTPLSDVFNKNKKITPPPLLQRKIINDPVYGFITVDHPLVLKVIEHPYYQRLRRIQQMAFANLVYPGAVHSRLHHSLGAYHLMHNALAELRSKNFPVTQEEELGAKIAILLHDIGHGPFSHALEKILIENTHHEALSILIMELLNETFQGQLDTALAIFNNNHPKRFLHQLVSGQLDVDRMDYLTRDSFFTGVSEGVIGYDRIIKMLTVVDGELMVEEKGIYSIEKFLVARRLMYWQVYLHKTVLCAEKMLEQIVRRARELIHSGRQLSVPSPSLDFFLHTRTAEEAESRLDQFSLLDDYDIVSAIKAWMNHPDSTLSCLCRFLMERRLLKVKLQGIPFEEDLVEGLRKDASKRLGIPESEASYFVFTGEAANTTYDPSDERINILFKDGSVRDISKVDNAIIHQTLSSPVKKFYICYLK